MRRPLHDVWGCARGPVRRLAPPSRLAAGAASFAAAMVAPAATARGSFVVVAIAAAWLGACRPPGRLVRWTLGIGLLSLLPYFLLVPWLPAAAAPGAAGSWQAWSVPWTVLLRGLAGMSISLATVASLSASDLREALVRLPVPRVVAAILLQIVHQTATLGYETERVAAALAVRGASQGRLTAWRLVASLPRVWLPRVVMRAERVAAAMELRGYCDAELRSFRSVEASLADAVVLTLALAALGLTVALRLFGAA